MNKNKVSILICIIIFFSILSLSGCVSNQNAESINLSKFFGTWTGNLDIQMFGESNNSTINHLTFDENIVKMDLTNDRGTYTMNYTYKVEGDKLILQPEFNSNGGPFNRPQYNNSQPFNDTRPHNNSWSPNGTIPPNESWPSDNGTRPPNWGQPMDEQRPMSISFVYDFNEENNILYLNGSQFLKFQ